MGTTTQIPTTGLVLISLDDLRLVIGEIVEDKMNEYNEKNKEDTMITVKEALGILRVDKSTLWHWDKEGYLKKVHVGGKVRYRESEVKKIAGIRKK